MTTFDEREKGYEAKYAHDQETAFRVRVRRNKLLGRWTAEKIGITGDANEIYAKGFATVNVEANDVTVVAKVMHALAEKGVSAVEAEVRQQMSRLGEKAKADLTKS
jgi:hypothetical protein